MDTVLALMLSLAVVSDLRWRRVPDALTVAGLIAALGLRLAMDPALATEGSRGAVLGMAVAIPLVITGALGVGDSALLIAFGAFLGTGGLPIALLAAAITGGIMSGIVSWRSRVLGLALSHTKDLAIRCLAHGRWGERIRLSSTFATITVPSGPASAAGARLGSVAMGTAAR